MELRRGSRDICCQGVRQSLRMLEIVVKTENGERHVRVSAQEPAGLVRRTGSDHGLVHRSQGSLELHRPRAGGRVR
ncbi:hypothetical protein B7R87_31050 [Streptomyces tsukubensis]|uniref:Uncharacterized protein n=1 Tax=Streptomyces tsukubensis (strain DSM 42081 / NBRC 108919 / NRRL 18488 / 9993) TaxID=1114943 RepID=A0A7G3UAW6_STRT9|nr:hypothetical protein B7R87_31050 [Streptomyces tsukubensis]QKM66240.1 hypothetical protein STSU_002725 [Streptomyces tsukubensis NRRL18488]